MDSTKRHGSVSSIRSVERAFDLLEALERSRQPMRLTDLGRLTGMPKATVQRLLGVLERRGVIDKAQGRYQIGAGVVPLAHAFLLENPLTKAAFPVLQELGQTSGETVSLFVRLGLNCVLVQRVEGLHPLRYVLPIGQRMPLHVGAGKVLAAAMPDGELHQLVDQLSDMRLATGEPLTRKALLAELNRVRRQGYAISRSERVMGIASVTVPVVDPTGATIAALSVSGLSDRMTSKKLERLLVELRQAAQAIATRYGTVK
jgi:IclR family acetate operon transcriptional repressor